MPYGAICHNEGKQNRYAEGVSMFCFFYSIRPEAFWQGSRWRYSLFSHASQNEKRICLSQRGIWYVAKLWNESKILSWQFERFKSGFAKGKSGYRNDTGTKGQGLAANKGCLTQWNFYKIINTYIRIQTCFLGFSIEKSVLRTNKNTWWSEFDWKPHNKMLKSVAELVCTGIEKLMTYHNLRAL